MNSTTLSVLPGALSPKTIKALSFFLGVSEDELQMFASNAGACYATFIKRSEPRPFEKKPRRRKPRRIDNPSIRLKYIQRRIHDKLLRELILPNNIIGGVKGKSPLDNARLHQGARLLVTLDIKNCFPNISSSQVYSVWRHMIGCTPAVASLLTKLTTFERKLPQGAPTSTALANLVIHSVDTEIRRICALRGVQYSIFVDDLAFSGDSARSIIGTAVAALRSVGLPIAREKLKIMGPRDQKTLTGLVVGAVPGISRAHLSRIRSGIHMLKIGAVSEYEAEKYLRNLEGRIAHVRTVSYRRALALRNELERAKESHALAFDIIQ